MLINVIKITNGGFGFVQYINIPLKSPPSGVGGNTQLAETQIAKIETVAGTIKFQFFMVNRYFDKHRYKLLTNTAQKLGKSIATVKIICRR